MTDWNEQMRRKAEEDARQQRGFDAQAARLMSPPQREAYENAFNQQKKK